MIERARKRLDRKAKKGLRGWPVATVALYGPDDRRATKLAVGIVPAEGAEASDLRRWLSEGQGDIRADNACRHDARFSVRQRVRCWTLKKAMISTGRRSSKSFR